MNRKIVTIILLTVLSSFVLSSCETPVGQGAGIRAATGAIIAGAATGHIRRAAIVAAAGAAAGALVGAAVEEARAASYGPPPPVGVPVPGCAGAAVFDCIAYTGRVFDL